MAGWSIYWHYTLDIKGQVGHPPQPCSVILGCSLTCHVGLYIQDGGAVVSFLRRCNSEEFSGFYQVTLLQSEAVAASPGARDTECPRPWFVFLRRDWEGAAVSPWEGVGGTGREARGR